MAHCPAETSYCNRSSDSYTYSWDTSAISEYLNGIFLTSLESQIGDYIIIPATVCNDPSRGDNGDTFGGYLKSQIETTSGATCNIGKNNNYSDYKVRLITYGEYNLIKNNSKITGKTTWLYSSSIGWWWSMASYSYLSSTHDYVKVALDLTDEGSWFTHNAQFAQGVRAVITISK